MSGRDVREQVLETLANVYPHDPESTCHSEAHAALAPCVVLTREEADSAWAEFSEAMDEVWGGTPRPADFPSLALLTPDADEEECEVCNGAGCNYCADEGEAGDE